MNFQFIMKHNNLKKEKNKNRDNYYFENLINDNNEKFLENYQNYLKNTNKIFICSRHNIFNACNQNNLERILSHYGSSALTEEFEKKVVRALNFKFELLENYKMHKEDIYLRSLLKIENHIIDHKLKQKKIETNFDNNFFYEKMFFLENFFFVNQIKNINEVLQNNELMNEANHIKIHHDKIEKNLKHYSEYKKYSNNFYINFNFLKSLKINRFFLLNLRNIYVEKKNYSIQKFGYLYLLEYLNNQGIWSIINNTKLNNRKLEIKSRRDYMDYKRKILENLEYIDFNYAKEKMGDKYFYVLQKEDIEKKIKGLNILKILILKAFRQYSNEKKFNKKYKYPLRIIITGKIKREIKELAKYLKNIYSLKIYDFKNIKKEICYICKMEDTKNDLSGDKNKDNFIIEKKRKILIKLKDIIRKLNKKKINKKILDNLYVDLLYYRIKYDYDMFYTNEHNCNVKGDVLKEKEISNIKVKKSKKYRGYIIINFFFSLKQYILFELKSKKLFLFNNFIYENISYLQNRNLSVKKKKEKFSKEYEMLSNSKFKNIVTSKKMEGTNYEKHDKMLKKIKNEGNRNKNLNTTKENIELNKKSNYNTDDIYSLTEKNILFFSNFLCKIDEFFYANNCTLGGIDLHFHIDRNMKQITNFLFRFINRNSSCHFEERNNNNNNNKYDNTNNKNDEENILKLKKTKRIIIRTTRNTQTFHSQIYKSNCRITCKFKKFYKKLEHKIKKDTNCDFFCKGTFNENKKIFFSNFHLIKKFFHLDKNYIEIENFLKSYKSSKYSRYHILKRNIYKSASNLISKVITLIKKDKMKCNDKKRKKNNNNNNNNNTEKNIENLNKKETDINDIISFIKDIKLDKKLAYYFRLKYCNIIKVYVTHLFNFFVWKKILEKNISKVVKYIHKNVYLFLDYTNIEDINEFIQFYNGYQKYEIENEKVKFLLMEKLSIIQKKIWLEILKQKNNTNKKEKNYLNKWINIHIFLLVFQNFYLINIEHQLYLNLDYFVNEFLYALIHNDITFKNEKNMLIFSYLPKNKKELYIYEKNNYYFPFLNYIKENINNFLIENGDYKKNMNKDKSSELNSDSFYSKREKQLSYIAKEFRSINSCRFFYKFHELVNYSIINLRKYFLIFQDLNNYINNFITIHYLCIYKQINFMLDKLRNFIQNSRQINFCYLWIFNKRKFKFLDKTTNKLNEMIYKNTNLENNYKENNYIFYEEKKKINLKNNNKIKKKEKNSKGKYKCSYVENSFDNNLTNHNNNNENSLWLKKNYIYIFLKSILNYIFITQSFPLILKVDLGNIIMSSLFFIKEKSEKIYTYLLFKKILNEYVKKYGVTISFFMLKENMINNINSSYISLRKNKEKNQNRKMDKERVEESVKKEIFKNYFFLFNDLRSETKNFTNNSEIKTNDLAKKNISKNNYYNNHFKNDCDIEKNNVDSSEVYLCLQSLEYFTFKEFLHLGLFNFIKDKKKITKDEKKVLNYEIISLNKFVFNYFFSFSKFPYFHENIQIYIKNYLSKKNISFFSLFEEVIKEKIQNIDRVNSQLFNNNKKKKNIEIKFKINNIKNERINSHLSYNMKKKVMIKEILIFFLNRYDYNI
ncbi:conserved Plasmodium protein, unknown function [Plasmodium gallinaceum]|uniref:Uncharacterized protein n=1 Tax=Plasmodium gallinaceum TaxID=5849 RepID=A0A1J1GPE2_PLAGA|nr:conserved Plasmodium protein, unknown function [Plasmodium gallinaceum]CRG94306.1 conserved Plasmodium protein, unknown function [Plasmodium gallinaceum]